MSSRGGRRRLRTVAWGTEEGIADAAEAWLRALERTLGRAEGLGPAAWKQAHREAEIGTGLASR